LEEVAVEGRDLFGEDYAAMVQATIPDLNRDASWS
jgi:hypothetical protein